MNDAARESLPEELRFAIVLTIFESKGLEFDDILLYNFFKDSQVRRTTFCDLVYTKRKCAKVTAF